MSRVDNPLAYSPKTLASNSLELVWCFATADRQEARNARRARARDHGVAVGVEFAAGKVAVAVNECRF